jgi:hypothetical protein
MTQWASRRKATKLDFVTFAQLRHPQRQQQQLVRQQPQQQLIVHQQQQQQQILVQKATQRVSQCKAMSLAGVTFAPLRLRMVGLQ